MKTLSVIYSVVLFTCGMTMILLGLYGDHGIVWDAGKRFICFFIPGLAIAAAIHVFYYNVLKPSNK